MNKLIMLAGVSFGILGCGNSGSDSDADLEKLIRSNNLTAYYRTEYCHAPRRV
jgi:hypothetical protein